MAGAPTPFVNAFAVQPTGSFRYNTSQAGTAIAIVYGTQRVPINLLEGFDYTAVNGGKGGKGGAGGKGTGGKKGGARYSVFVAFGICQGPVSFTGASLGSGGFNRVWSNGGVAYANGVGLNLYAGNDGQAPDPVFETTDTNQPVIGYSGLAYATGTPLELGNSPALPNISFEVRGVGAGTIGPNYPDDANPALIIEDLLTNPRYGAGFPAANLDSAGSLADFGVYCQAVQFAMSLLLDRPQPAAQWLKHIAELTVAAVVWSGALLKVIPYYTGAIAANGASWTPNLTVQYSVTDDDIVPWQGGARSSTDAGTDPVVVGRTDPAELTNWMSLEYYDKTNNYNPNVIPYFDQGAIDRYGVKTEPAKQAHAFTNPGSAWTSAFFQVNRLQSNRNQPIKFQLGWRFMLLEPMDIIEVTDLGAGLDAAPVRIVSIVETENGELQIEAEALPGVSSSAPVFASGSSAGAPLNLYAAPGNVNTPVIFEPPTGLTAGANEVWIAASGGPNWGGCNILVSHDGNTFAPVGAVFGDAKMGVLTAPLPSYGGANPDNIDTLAVDLSESGGQLVSFSAADAANNISLCYVDGELVAYQTATLTASSKYSLTVLQRGAYGSPIGSHPAGAQFSFLGLPQGAGVFRYAYPANLIGQTVYFKFQSFNLFGLEAQDVSTLTVYSHTLNGSGTNPLGNPVLAALAGGTNADWGIVGTTLIGSADLDAVTLPTGATINLGTVA